MFTIDYVIIVEDKDDGNTDFNEPTLTMYTSFSRHSLIKLIVSFTYYY